MVHKLWKSSHIISSDEDQLIVEDLYVGFNTDMDLLIVLDHTDYEDKANGCSVTAIVSKENAYLLSQRHKVSMSLLPEFLSSSQEEYSSLVNPDCNQVQECFQAITHWLIHQLCPYQLVRQYGKSSNICG